MTKVFLIFIAFVVVIIIVIVYTHKNMFLTTADNVKIAYNWVKTKNPKGYLVLIHMMPATKESWQDFALAAKNAGYSSIAIDLRGHGQSDGGPNGYQKFSDEEHGKSKLDIAAALEFLKSRGAPAEKTYLIGASIGANLNLWHLAANPKLKKAVLLSAGLDYHGVKTDEPIRQLKSDQKVLLVAAKDDERSGGNNVEMNQKLKTLAPENAELIIYETGGHGTDLLKSHPDLIEKILAFLNS